MKRLLLFALCCGFVSAQSSLILLGAGGPNAVVSKAFVAGGKAAGYTSGGLMIPNITLNVGTAGNRALFVAVFTEPGCGNCNTGVTYAGTAMAQITYYATTIANVTLWYLASPTSGSNDVSYTFSVGYENVSAVAWSYSGASQSIPTNFVTGTATQMSPFTESLTISGSTSWLAGTWFSAASTLFGGTGTTVRTGIANYVGVDSGATVPPGSRSLQVTNLSGLSETEIWILWELS